MHQILNFINGQHQPASNGGWLDDFEPATGQALARIPDSGAEDVNAAVTAAEAAFPEWSARPVAERARLLERLADLVAERAADLAALESDDTGKPVTLAREVDMMRAEANLRFFAGAVQHWSGASHDMGAAGLNYTLRRPLGVVACITPWNLPLYLLTWKLGPALATGNTVVAKPSELTPLTAHALGELALEAGFPPGVLNIVHGTGPGAGQPLVDHAGIRAISFTGGTVTGRKIAATAAPRLIKLSLELGGKNPAVVFDDVDIAATAAGLARAGFTNQGQVCLCCSRVLIHEKIYDQLLDALVREVAALQSGDPRDETTRQGALISEAHRDKVMSYIEQARADGGRILTGGETLQPGGRCSDGWFVQPTVIDGLPAESRVLKEEIFGPVVTVERFSDEAAAVESANDVPYGLAATVWTKDLGRAHRVAAALQSGIVWINGWLVRDLRTPFGGVKQSGVGREGGFHSLEFFTEAKNICIVHE